MTKIYNNMGELVGRTPLVRFGRMEKLHGTKGRLIVKMEMFNPSGSVKDRISLAMVEEAEKRGILKEGSVIIEPTSGNTGIGLAMVGAAKGYRVILTMPETMSAERRNILKAYGAELVLTEGSKGMKGAIARADELVKEIEGGVIPGQFVNFVNPEIHRRNTGPEIWKDTGGDVDVLVAGIGTGGTITGAGEFLRTKNPGLKVIAVEPAGSPVLSEGRSGVHRIQGIGAGFVPDVLNVGIYDEIIAVTDEDAFVTGREIARVEGALVGVSTGAAIWAAIKVASRPEFEGKNIVVISADSGDRYLSTPMFAF
ncbi:MAG: cysteine synthase A [Candidatus Methanomethylophilaceae archaeon]|nr:cysteine synthase [Candidatus Methanomethylophilaceae archaeon]